MSDELHYKLTLGVSESVNVEELEEFMQALFLDLYEQGSVESISVTKDGYVQSSDGIEELLSMLDEVESNHIRRAIESAEKMEDITDDG